MAYPKFKKGEECAYPERTICNYCDCGKLQRCPYMKFISVGNWHCIYKKELKSDKKQSKSTEATKENNR